MNLAIQEGRERTIVVNRTSRHLAGCLPHPLGKLLQILTLSLGIRVIQFPGHREHGITGDQQPGCTYQLVPRIWAQRHLHILNGPCYLGLILPPQEEHILLFFKDKVPLHILSLEISSPFLQVAKSNII